MCTHVYIIIYYIWPPVCADCGRGYGYLHTHARTHTHTQTNKQNTYTCTGTYTHTHTHTCIHTDTNTNKHVCTDNEICEFTGTGYIHTYIHTYIPDLQGTQTHRGINTDTQRQT